MITLEQRRQLLFSFIDQFPLKEDIGEALRTKLSSELSEESLKEVIDVLQTEIDTLREMAAMMETQDEQEFEKVRQEIDQIGEELGVQDSE